MTENRLPERPLVAVGEFSGGATADLFALLADETRLEILLALWAAHGPSAEGPGPGVADGEPVPFSTLRHRVGIGHGGQFTYHLDQLVGGFVHRSDDGYRLTSAGTEIVRTVIAVAGLDEPGRDRTDRESGFEFDLELDCPLCGGRTVLTHRHRRVYRVCTACDGYHAADEAFPGGLLAWAPAAAGALRGRSPRAAFDAVRTKLHHDNALRAAGVCTACGGPVGHRIDVCSDHQPTETGPCPSCGRGFDPAVRSVCSACGHWTTTSVTEVAMTHPAVGAFAWHHGLALGYDAADTSRWIEVVADHDQTVRARSPVRVEVTLAHDGDDLGLTVGPDLSVLAVRGGV